MTEFSHSPAAGGRPAPCRLVKMKRMPGLETPLTEQANPASANIDALPTEDVLRIISAEDRKVAEAVEREIPAIARKRRTW